MFGKHKTKADGERAPCPLSIRDQFFVLIWKMKQNLQINESAGCSVICRKVCINGERRSFPGRTGRPALFWHIYTLRSFCLKKKEGSAQNWSKSLNSLLFRQIAQRYVKSAQIAYTCISIYAYKVGEGGIVYKIFLNESEFLAKFKLLEIYFSTFSKSIDGGT